MSVQAVGTEVNANNSSEGVLRAKASAKRVPRVGVLGDGVLRDGVLGDGGFGDGGFGDGVFRIA